MNEYRGASAFLAAISNCSVLDAPENSEQHDEIDGGENDDAISAIIRDHEEREDITLTKQIGKGGE